MSLKMTTNVDKEEGCGKHILLPLLKVSQNQLKSVFPSAKKEYIRFWKLQINLKCNEPCYKLENK